MEDAIAGIFTFLLFAFFIATYVIAALAVSKIATLSGYKKDAWFAWLPIMHELLLLKITKKPEWYIVLIYFVPVVNWVMRWWLQYELIKHCRKPGWWIAIWIFFFFPAYPFMIWKMAKDFEEKVVPAQDFAYETGEAGQQESYF